MHRRFCFTIAALVVISFLYGCATPLPPANQMALDNAASIDFDVPDGLSADNVCYVQPNPVVAVKKINNSPVEHNSSPFLSSGTTVLTLQYMQKPVKQAGMPAPPISVGAVTMSMSLSPGGDMMPVGEPANITFNCEAGKSYVVVDDHSGFLGSKVTFTIKEIQEPGQRQEAEQKLAAYKRVLTENPAKKAAYLAFSKENPAYLEGTWQFKNSGSIVSYQYIANLGISPTLTFTGNTYKFDSRPDSKLGITYIGTFAFNENTMIINNKSIYSHITKKEIAGEEQKGVYQYERKGDSLFILEKVGFSLLGGYAGAPLGEYIKVK